MLGVLLLRGAQTPGELKQRTERWHSFRSLDDVEETLQRFAEKGYVRQLERRPGQKESRWINLVVEPGEAPVGERACGRGAGVGSECAGRDRGRRTPRTSGRDRTVAGRPQPGNRRGHPQRRHDRRARDRAEGRAGPARPTRVGRPWLRRAGRARARLSRPPRERSRRVCADHHARGRQADRAVAQRDRGGAGTDRLEPRPRRLCHRTPHRDRSRGGCRRGTGHPRARRSRRARRARGTIRTSSG